MSASTNAEQDKGKPVPGGGECIDDGCAVYSARHGYC